MTRSAQNTERIVATPGEGALWTAVQRLIASEYDLCGELGATADGRRAAYVAALRAPSGGVRLLVVERAADASGAYEVAFQDTLDETIPARGLSCEKCGHQFATWGTVCPECKSTLALTSAPRGTLSRADAQSLVASSLGAQSTILGELRTTAGSVIAIVRHDPTGQFSAVGFSWPDKAGGTARAVTIGSLKQPTGSGPRRPSSPHSGEIGPLTVDDRALVSGEAPEAPLICPKCRSRYERDVRFCPVDGAELTNASVSVDLIGRVLNGKFRVVKLLGEGGMGRVYLAEHVRIHRRCALKVLSPALVGHPESIRRFDGEARNASRIAHPNVATVYDFEETSDGLVYIILEYVEGETLGAILTREIWLDVPRAVRIGRDVAAALQAAHDLGIVHRDLKPDNIMIAKAATGEDLVKVVDFGIAKAAEEAETNARVTRTGYVVGTPRYMSPEQYSGEAVDSRSDVYSLGCVLYEAVTGKSASTADTGKGTKYSLRQKRNREGVPRSLERLIQRAMNRDPVERYQTAQEMKNALDLVLKAIERREHALRRRRAFRIAGGLVAVAAIAAVVWRLTLGTHGVARSQDAGATPTPKPVAATPAPAPARPTATAAVSASPSATPKASATRPAAQPSHAGSDVDRYLATVATSVRTAWHEALHGTTPTGTERATFALLIGADGRVIHLTPVHLSDVPDYDDAVGAAVQNIPTFGAPPAALIGTQETVALRLVFQGPDLIVHAADAASPTTPDQ